MLRLEKDNPAYNAALEVLAMLSKRPTVTRLDLLTEDMGLTSYSELRPMFAELDRRGVSVVLWREKGERVAAIRDCDWRLATGLAEKYVDAMDRYSLAYLNPGQ